MARIATVEELKRAIVAIKVPAIATRKDIPEYAEIFASVLNMANKELVLQYWETTDIESNLFLYCVSSASYFRKTKKSALVSELSWQLGLRAVKANEQTVEAETRKLVDYRGLLNYENPFLEDNKKINEILDANFDLLDSCTAESEIYAVCMNTETGFLRYLYSEKFTNFDKNAAYTHEELAKFFASNEMASREYRKEKSKMTTTITLEQETGYTYYRDKGLLYMQDKISAADMNTLEGPEYLGMAHGLATAFGIAIEGKSYSELISEIKEFIKNREFEKLSPIDKLVIAPEELPEISEEAHETACKECYELGIEARRARNGHENLQAEINEVREKWKAVQTTLRTFNTKENRHLAGLKMLAKELRQRYFDLRLMSLRFYPKTRKNSPTSISGR